LETLYPDKFKGLLNEVYFLLRNDNDYKAYAKVKKSLENFRNENLDESFYVYPKLNKKLTTLEELKNSDELSNVFQFNLVGSEYRIVKSDSDYFKKAYPVEDGKKKLGISFSFSYSVFRIFPF
jgi:hypothetical protein